MNKVCVVGLSVTDMDKAIEYYATIGFPVRDRQLYPHYVELDHEDRDRFMFILARTRKPSPQTLLNFETPDLIERMRELSEKGVTSLDPEPRTFPEGVNAAYQDPSGNTFELLEFTRPTRPWHRAPIARAAAPREAAHED
jgi:catechol 2,3-dioxygenase-like lactoylglutathione lyase family enzyme